MTTSAASAATDGGHQSKAGLSNSTFRLNCHCLATFTKYSGERNALGVKCLFFMVEVVNSWSAHFASTSSVGGVKMSSILNTTSTILKTALHVYMSSTLLLPLPSYFCGPSSQPLSNKYGKCKQT